MVVWSSDHCSLCNASTLFSQQVRWLFLHARYHWSTSSIEIQCYSCLTLFSFLVCAFVAFLNLWATQRDIWSSEYFVTTINRCDFEHFDATPCYCNQTESQFSHNVGMVGNIDCDNVFTRNTAYLIANAALSVACLIISILILVTLLASLIERLCTVLCN